MSNWRITSIAGTGSNFFPGRNDWYYCCNFCKALIYRFIAFQYNQETLSTSFFSTQPEMDARSLP